MELPSGTEEPHPLQTASLETNVPREGYLKGSLRTKIPKFVSCRLNLHLMVRSFDRYVWKFLIMVSRKVETSFSAWNENPLVGILAVNIIRHFLRTPSSGREVNQNPLYIRKRVVSPLSVLKGEWLTIFFSGIETRTAGKIPHYG